MIYARKKNNLILFGAILFRYEAVEGELNFYDIMLAWSRIIKSKYALNGCVLFGCGLNEFANESEFLFSGACHNDFFVNNADVWLDYRQLPFKDDEFDFIVSSHLVEEGVRLDTVSETVRVLNSGGYLLLFYFHAPSICFLQKHFSGNSFKYPGFYTSFSVRRFLFSLDMEVVSLGPVSFRPFASNIDFAKMVYLEFLGATVMPFLSSCSFVLAQKKTFAGSIELGEYAL